MNDSSLPSQSSLLSVGTGKPIWVDETSGILHELCTVHVVVGNSLLASFELDPGAWPSLGYRRDSVSFFCPSCGDIWGRLVFVNSKGQQQRFEVVTVACERHPDAWQVPGSLLAGRLEALVHLYPRPVLERELKIYLKGD